MKNCSVFLANENLNEQIFIWFQLKVFKREYNFLVNNLISLNVTK